MNKTLSFLTAYLATAIQAFAQVEQPLTVMAKQDGALAVPTAETFKAANEIATTPKFFSAVVDTSPTISYLSGQKIDFFATDAELKISVGDTLAYRASTIQDSNFFANPKSDVNCKIFFQCSEISGDASEGRRWWPFIAGEFSSIGEQAKAMAGTEGYPEVNNILFQPNVDGTLVDGTQVGDIWNVDNVALRPTTLRFNALGYEQSQSGNYRWRIANWASRTTKYEAGYNVWEPSSSSDWASTTGTPIVSEDGATCQVNLSNRAQIGYVAYPEYLILKLDVSNVSTSFYLVMETFGASNNFQLLAISGGESYVRQTNSVLIVNFYKSGTYILMFKVNQGVANWTFRTNTSSDYATISNFTAIRIL